MINNIKKFAFSALLLMLSLILISCSKSGETKEFSSYLPPKTVDITDEILPDENSSFVFNDISIVKNENNEDTLLISYDWTNLSPREKVGMEAYLLTAKQYNTSLEPDLSVVSDKKKLVTQIESEETLEDIEQGFILTDTEGEVVFVLEGTTDIVIDTNGKPIMSYPVEIPVEISKLN